MKWEIFARRENLAICGGWATDDSKSSTAVSPLAPAAVQAPSPAAAQASSPALGSYLQSLI